MRTRYYFENVETIGKRIICIGQSRMNYKILWNIIIFTAFYKIRRTLVGFADECKQLGSQGLIMLSYIKEKSSMTVAQIANVKSQLQKISSLINTLSSTQNNVEIIGTLVESELQSMDKAIEETVAKIQVLNDKSTYTIKK